MARVPLHPHKSNSYLIANVKLYFKVHIQQIDGPHSLKYFLNMAGPDVICVGSSGAAQVVLKRVEREASHRYQTLTLPEDGASGCIFVNGTLVHRSKEETPKCEAVI